MTMGLVDALAAAKSGPRGPLVHLLGNPSISIDDRAARLAESGTRLLAFLCLNNGDNDRRYVAANLWPDVDEFRAAGNLRTTLWRVNGRGPLLVDATKTSLRLNAHVQVDVRLLGDWAARVISGNLRQHDLDHAAWDVERLEILPGWYEDWVILERERLRQRLLHALETLGRRLMVAGRCAEAIDLAIVAVMADPLRESSQQLLIEAHLAEGNRAQARRAFNQHRDLLRSELGVNPSPRLEALVRDLAPVPRAVRPPTASRGGARRGSPTVARTVTVT